ncbi:ZIP zinc/iron transport family [Ustulina deusta]|nr:ZIP zinc/iron transport family [Ustulina deusta]KAI3343266.1 ZIP zinc/iron transport family [Ustulina deusta]
MSITSAAMDVALKLREAEGGGRSVLVNCDPGNDYDGRFNLRISSIFVIFLGSLLGAVLPVYLSRHTKLNVNGKPLFVAKYFGSGVIIGTAFLHLLSPAFDALRSPCLADGPIKEYDFAAAITLIAIFVMFTLELVVSRFDIFGHSHEAEGTDPSRGVLRISSPDDLEANSHTDGSQGSAATEAKSGFHPPGLPNDVSYPPGGQDHLGHYREHVNGDVPLAMQMTAIFILEFGVVFHSIFIGLTLAVAGDEFNVLYVVLVFHQTFEGLGLGSRLAAAQWPESKRWLPYLLGFGYSVSTPISIGIGIGIRMTLQPGSPNALLINGVFDAISAGILIYTGLVELLAHEFMFNPQMRNAGIKVQLWALLCVAIGIGLMAVLAVWA